MRKIVLGIFFSLIAICSFAKDSPIQNYKYRYSLYSEVEFTYEGKQIKTFHRIEDIYKETDGWAYIKGYGKIHFWLYDTYSNMDGDGDLLLFKIIPEWVEEMGYVIDYDQVRKISPDQDVPSSVKTLMKQRGCDEAAALITSDASYPYGKSPCLVFHSYDKERDSYWTWFYPLY